MVTPGLAHAAWRTSSHSGSNAQCVEVAPLAGATAVRDSQHRAGGTLLVPRARWSAFVAEIAREHEGE